MIVNHRQRSFSDLKTRADRTSLPRRSRPRLRWQSQSVLLVAITVAAAGILSECIAFVRTAPTALALALAFGAGLAFLTWRFRAATLAGAVAGGLFTIALYLATPGWRTALWPLLGLLLLTLGATRFGRARKEGLGVAEARHGRTAAQVAANLGVAVIASVPLGFARFFVVSRVFGKRAMALALAAALAEAAADTLSSEIGEVLGGNPLLLTTFRRVPAGTDGAISIAGTVAGISGAVVIAAVAAFALNLSVAGATRVALAAIAGLFVDSLLGAILERRGWFNNDAVNFLSTLASALFAAGLSGV